MSDNYGVQIERLAAQFEESKRVNEELRASNAALKADNEALKKLECPSCGRNSGGQELRIFKNLTTALETARAELKRYTSWQPSDPGTKEAMAYVAAPWHIAYDQLKEYVDDDEKPLAWKDHARIMYERAQTLATSLAAAMVWLKDAEKKNAQNVENATSNEAIAERLNAALTASLASVKKERDTFKAQWEHSARARFTDAESAEASLAELRRRMEIARFALEKAEHGLIVTHNLDASEDPERGFLNAFVIDNGAEMKAVEEALALIGRSSGPGPAPVESKPTP